MSSVCKFRDTGFKVCVLNGQFGKFPGPYTLCNLARLSPPTPVVCTQRVRVKGLGLGSGEPQNDANISGTVVGAI